jgi:nucleotide-binding universal stress UspA family protein
VFRPSILCPVDFSDPSRGALRFAATIAEHFYARLVVAHVEDSLLAAPMVDVVYGQGESERQIERELRRFVTDTFQARQPTLAALDLRIATGKPAFEILRLAFEQQADLIVMNTHGRTGVEKVLFGSTTERVLRETFVPILVTPAGDAGPMELEDLKRGFRGVLAPVDLSGFSRQQAAIAHGLANALNTTLTLLHVVEPVGLSMGPNAVASAVAETRKQLACEGLDALAQTLLAKPTPEVIITAANPATEIAKLAGICAFGAIVMGLHAAADLRPRMGSVTYRVLCHCAAPVLALPPAMPRISPEREQAWTRNQHAPSLSALGEGHDRRH